ncbi:MAG TPA: NADP oxidoreductase [candidate division Zixibacteria bacterium]|jgi:NAD-reducing hydrogenase small subunit|nr:NADP oxidoreductase [candidate division Zixibacteria bacterium]
MSKVRLATVWLDGCSGCHMSFLDMDERLAAVLEKVDIVYSPIVDIKEFPENVDVTVVEGSVSSEDDLEKIRKIRKNSKIVISLGDCAVTGNVPSMRDLVPQDELLNRVYIENASSNQQIPTKVVPKLLPRVHPLHEVVKVDYFVPGCPPSADTIFNTLLQLVEGRAPEAAMATRFGI